MEVPKEVIETAKQIYQQHKEDFPEDGWESIEHNGQIYDVNLWIEDERKHVTIYPVYDGLTDVTTFRRII